MKTLMKCIASALCFASIAQLQARSDRFALLTQLKSPKPKAQKEFFGPKQFEDKTFNTAIKVMGPLTAEKLNAPGLDIYGPAEITNSKIIEATIRGPLTTENTIFAGLVEVHGNITAKGSAFNGLLETTGSDIQVVLEDTQAKDIIVNVQESGQVTQRDGVLSFLFTTKKEEAGTQVILKGNTKVTGSIIFKDGEGTVKIEDDAQHTGQVKGAKEDQELS